MRVRVYWNSVRKQWAVVRQGERRVFGYADSLTLEDVTWRVSYHGNQHACQSGHVNRHKWAEGTLVSFESGFLGCHPVDYWPETMRGFTNSHTQEEVTHSPYVDLTSHGLRYITCPDCVFPLNS